MKSSLSFNTLSLLLLMLAFVGTAEAYTDCRNLTDMEIVQRLIMNSRAGFTGACACPDDRDSWGRRCGGRSAWSQPGNEKPLCYAYDVSDDYVYRYRQYCNEIHNYANQSPQQIIMNSRAEYKDECPCPYDTDASGKICGNRSAWTRTGGAHPICYETDKTSSYFPRLEYRYTPDRDESVHHDTVTNFFAEILDLW